MEKAKYMLFCFIDDTKAFDWIGHNKLWIAFKNIFTEIPQLPIKGYGMYDEEAIVEMKLDSLIDSKLGKENSRMHTVYTTTLAMNS